ncbi:nucleotidyltransferase domain-containing protein [Thermofilum pendens]|uniref:DNA polymerase, beta domain protein region n=1 Tax=Thermofilum pendens (strain DSM 2475 / Hrk 5) TaxID=368408 RepID=A1RYW8_THEPD|nr:nucleotidyltransferase domain-containing protein [Thermofilum pendens]ABL78398.1 DNA polymerase, beta domain protein region [Thermofilum pendens Hrk 5]
MLLEGVKSRLSSLRDPCVKAVLVFGSVARGEQGERSDLDLLVLHEGCAIEDPVARRRYFYALLREAVGDLFEDLTVLDMELKRFLEPGEVSPLLLNVYWDAVVVYDATGLVEGFLRRAREGIVRSGLRRVKDGKAYRWILPKPAGVVRVLD